VSSSARRLAHASARGCKFFWHCTLQFSGLITTPTLPKRPASRVTHGMDARFRASLQSHIADHCHVIDHVRQSFNWDCGLACTEAVLRTRDLHTTVHDLRLLCKTESVWSIDVAYLLRFHFGVDLTYFTVAVGVRPELRKEEFYRKQLPMDTTRVTSLFENAERNGVKVVQRSLQMSELVDALHGGDLIIVLLDKRMVQCLLCDDHGAKASSGFAPASSGFMGHYCILYAYSDSSHEPVFLMKDPASACDACCISAPVIERARRAFGTDEDVIVVHRRSSTPCTPTDRIKQDVNS
jgi:hypothetical protein